MIGDITRILGVVRAYFTPDQTSLGPGYAEDGFNMAEARKICADENSDLAQITTETEIKAAKYFLQAHIQHDFWIGLEKV